MELPKFTNMLLSGLFILGFICKGLSIPAPNDENIDYNIQGDDDYPSYQDEDESGIPNSDKVTPDFKTMDPPMFEGGNYSVNIRIGEDANLKCPVKNLAPNHIVLWYRGEDLVIQHMNPINTKANPHIAAGANHTLVIHNTTINDSGSYRCVVLPEQLNMTLYVELDVNESAQQSGVSKDAAHSFSVPIFLPIISVLLLLTTSSVSKFLRI